MPNTQFGLLHSVKLQVLLANFPSGFVPNNTVYHPAELQAVHCLIRQAIAC